jgi:exodeoxyribonuclease VII small subunit
MPRSTPPTPKPVEPAGLETFEQALGHLEEIIRRLEGGNLSLDESIQCFTEGMKLHAYCEQALKAARQKIDVLLRESGQIVPWEEEPPQDGS